MIYPKDNTEKAIIEYVDNNKNTIISNLQALIKVNTSYDVESISKKNPFGKGISKGFSTLKNILVSNKINSWVMDEDSWEYGYFIVGEKKQQNILFITHIDIVEANDAKRWRNNDPFSGELFNNYIYGRGALDDKAGIICAIWSSLAIKSLKLKLPFEIRTFVGGDEETTCNAQDLYIVKEKNPQLGIVADGEFPFSYGEKSIADVRISAPSSDSIIKEIKASNVINMVPSFCEVVVDLKYEKIRSDFNLFIETENINGTITRYEKNPNYACIKIFSDSNHAIFSNKCKNPITYMFKYLAPHDSNSIFSKFIGEILHNDSFGQKLDISKTDSESKEGTNVNVGCVGYSHGVLYVDLNIRFMSFLMSENSLKFKIDKFLHKWMGENEYSLKILWFNKGFVIDKKSKFWNNINNIYQSITGDSRPPEITPGVTYARNFPNSICMGPILTHIGDKYNAHCVDEKISIKSLTGAIKVYAILIYRLSKIWETLHNN